MGGAVLSLLLMVGFFGATKLLPVALDIRLAVEVAVSGIALLSPQEFLKYAVWVMRYI